MFPCHCLALAAAKKVHLHISFNKGNSTIPWCASNGPMGAILMLTMIASLT